MGYPMIKLVQAASYTLQFMSVVIAHVYGGTTWQDELHLDRCREIFND